MRRLSGEAAAVGILALVASAATAFEHSRAMPESWDWVTAQKTVGGRFTGTDGVTVILGDSNSYANQATRWVNYGKGHTDEEKAIMQWSHKGRKNDTDGWWLTSVDVQNGRSHTSASGVRADEYLKGGKHGLPSLDEIVKKYNPQVAFIALGTNDASAGQKPDYYIGNITKMVDKLYANGTMVIVMTVPTHPSRNSLVQQYNEQIYRLGAVKKFAVADVYGAFVERRPGDTWNGTLNRKDNVHFSFTHCAGPATEDNLRNDGYLLRCWVMIHKLIELKKHVVDGAPHPRMAALKKTETGGGRSASRKTSQASAGGSGLEIPAGADPADREIVQKALDEGLGELREGVKKAVDGGKKAWGYFSVEGRSRRGQVRGAGDKGLEVNLLGKGNTTIAWGELRPGELAAVAGKLGVSSGPKARLAVGISTMAAGRKMTGKRAMEKAVEADGSLKGAMEAALRVYK